MALPTTSFTTGPATLPDAGTLSYNGCIFSPLFETKLTGKVVKDEANRTTKLMEYELTADGYATMPDGATDINGVMADLRQELTKQGGALNYRGRGFDLFVNFGGQGSVQDVAWGPVPELLEFQPLGGGRSAKVVWKVTTRIPEIFSPTNPHGNTPRLLQLNYDTSVVYGEDQYSTLTMKGTIEVPMTRTPTQSTRTLTSTVDDFRGVLEQRILTGIDLTRFRVTHREFNVSRDKRTLDWAVTIEERPYMDPPPGCTLARGNYNVRPARAGMGLCLWLCTLKGTYTVRKDADKRVAWVFFLALMRLRMNQSSVGASDTTQAQLVAAQQRLAVINQANVLDFSIADFNRVSNEIAALRREQLNPTRRAWLVDFSFDEGLYFDSKTISFSATWRLSTIFQNILLASGLWTQLPRLNLNKDNLWAISMKDISGTVSWLPNRLDPALDVIVDFGGGV